MSWLFKVPLNVVDSDTQSVKGGRAGVAGAVAYNYLFRAAKKKSNKKETFPVLFPCSRFFLGLRPVHLDKRLRKRA